MSGGEDKSLRRRRRRWIWLVGIAIMAAAAAAGLARRSISQQARAAQSSPPTAARVTVAEAARHDVPIYLTGLGAVQASITVSIHAQVDGTLQEMPFTE